ncbi:MAG: hypothetical protein HY286_11635 [Planctomycetes bacterium]|nr:hypothetical protein [Planctomycetota bacterium]
MNRETIQYYLDGEMDAAERAAFEAVIARDPALRAEVDRYRSLDADLRTAYAPAGGEAERAIANLNIHENIRPFKRDPRKVVIGLGALAAVFVAGVSIGLLWAPAIRETPPETGKILKTKAPDIVNIGMLTIATGPCSFNFGKGEARAAVAGDFIQKGAELAVPAGARAACVSTDGSELYFDRDSSAVWDDARSLILTSGRVFARIAGGRPFTIRAGGAEMLAQPGSVQIENHGGAAEFMVYSGGAVIDGLGKPFMLKPGGRALAAKGSVMPDESGDDLLFSRAWALEIDAAAGGRDAAIVSDLGAMLDRLGQSKMPSDIYSKAFNEAAAACKTAVARFFTSDDAILHAELRRGAARLLAEIADEGLAPVLSRGTADSEFEIRKTCVGGLKSIASKTKGFDPSKYIDRKALEDDGGPKKVFK